MGQGVLTVFARYPMPGGVKTRLAEAIGIDLATELYSAFVVDLAARFAAEPYSVRWAVAPPDPGFARRFSLPRERCAAQRGADLGARLLDAFVAARSAGYSQAVVIGSDMPHLAPGRVREAIALLGEVDLVLGPADDGGYYLIAMREPRDVFSGVAWSTPQVLARTLALAGALRLRTALLEPGFDVDTVDDLRRLQSLLERSPEIAARCPATAELVAKIELPEGARVRTR